MMGCPGDYLITAHSPQPGFTFVSLPALFCCSVLSCSLDVDTGRRNAMTRFSLYVDISESVCLLCRAEGAHRMFVVCSNWYFMKKYKLAKNYVRSRAVPSISGDLLPFDIMLNH